MDAYTQWLQQNSGNITSALNPLSTQSGGWGNGTNTLSGFRFNPNAGSGTPFSNVASNFNNLMDAGNTNLAYSQLFDTPGAAGIFKTAFGGNMGDPNHDLASTLINTYSPGAAGGGALGSQYSYVPSLNGRADHYAAQQATANQYAGVPLSQIYGNAASGSFPAVAQGGGMTTPPPGTVAMPQSGAPSTGAGTAALPGVGSNSYSAPLTDPSAYLDPSMAFTMKQGMDALQNSAAASGNLLSGQTLKNIANYSQGLASTNWQNAMQNAMADTNRRYGVDNNDRSFAYNAQVGDRDFNNANAQFLASLGMQGTNANSQLAQSLATLLSGNSVAAGQAQGAGTIGANNALGSSLSQIISQLYGNNILSQLGLGGGNG